MGFGQAMGAAMDGWNESAANRRKDKALAIEEKSAADVSTYRGKQMEVMDFQIDAAKKDAKLKNSPAYKQAEAKKMELATKKTQAEIGLLNEMSGSTESTQAQQNATKLAKMEQTQNDTIARNTTIELNKDLYTLWGSDEPMDDTMITRLNNFRESEDAFKVQNPNPFAMYNPNNKKHEAGVMAAADKMLKGQGLDLTQFPDDKADEIMEDMVSNVKDFAKDGILLFDSVTGEVKSVPNLFNMTDTNDMVPTPAKKQFMKKIEETTAKNIRKNESTRGSMLEGPAEWEGGDGKTEGKGPMEYNLNGKMVDPVKYKQKLDYFKYPVPDDLKSVLKYNDGLINGKKGSGKSDGPASRWDNASKEQLRTGLDSLTMELDGLDPIEDKEEFYKAKTLIESGIAKLSDDSEKKTKRSALNDALKYSKAKAYVSKDAVSTGFQREMEVQETNSLNNNTTIQKTHTALVEKETFVHNADDVMTDIVDAEKNDVPILNVLMGDTFASKLSKVGAAESVVKEMSEWASGKDMTKKEFNKRLGNTIGINTKLTKIVVDYLKATSGATVGEEERSTITEMMISVVQGKTEHVLNALSTFRNVVSHDTQREVNNTLNIVSSLPITSKRILKLEDSNALENYNKVIAAKGKKEQEETTNTQGASTHGNRKTLTQPDGSPIDIMKGM